jgi:uncharacterized protein YxjI
MRYLIRQRLFAFKDDFWVTDEQGNRAFFINAKFLSLHQTLNLEDLSGQSLASIEHKLLTLTDAIDIKHDGTVVATVHKAVFSPLHHKSYIDLHGDNRRLEAVGNFFNKDFEIRDGHRVVAQVSRNWFQIRDAYGLDVASGEDDALFIAIAVCLDEIHSEEEDQQQPGISFNL